MTPRSLRSPTLRELPSYPLGKTGWPWTEESQQLGNTMPDGSIWPKISIVTPSYNQGQFIEETIRSVLLQGYPNLEYIIIDGGSTDNSLEIIKKYESWLACWVSEPDRGQSHAINKGIQKATGNILLWLNSDDICLPDAFGKAALAFHSNPSLSLVIGQARTINQQGQIIGELCSRFESWDELVTNPQNSVYQLSTFFSRCLFNELGLIEEGLHIAMDTDLMVRFTQFHSPLILNDFLTAFRIHKESKTHSHLLRGYEETDRVRQKYLSNKELRIVYRERSAQNWLSLFESDQLASAKRIRCILNSVRIHPRIVFIRDFWSAINKFILVKGN